MISRSGFTFGHNLIKAGYPIVEAVRAVEDVVDEVVAVDCGSTDGTRQLLEDLGCSIVDGKWGSEAGDTLSRAFDLHTECLHDNIIFFEADEVWDTQLLNALVLHMEEDHDNDIAVQRIQVEQNFQRVRWYPHPVHRIFPKGSVRKYGQTTDRHHEGDPAIRTASGTIGYIWDVTNCFRDNWFDRVSQQAKLWNEAPKYRMAPLHSALSWELTEEQAREELKHPRWEAETSPLDLPPRLQRLVGTTKYTPELTYAG